MYVHPQTSPSTTPFHGLLHSKWAGGDEGLSQLSVWRQSIAPGGATPPHRHDCDEIVMCSAGKGDLHIDGVVHQFSADSTVTLPRNVMHQIFSVGDEAMEIVEVLAASPVEVFLSDGNKIDLPRRT
jgi:quercetin dioxygenase-like cupin family protein